MSSNCNHPYLRYSIQLLNSAVEGDRRKSKKHKTISLIRGGFCFSMRDSDTAFPQPDYIEAIPKQRCISEGFVGKIQATVTLRPETCRMNTNLL